MTHVVSHHHHRQSLRSILVLHSRSTNIYTSAVFNESLTSWFCGFYGLSLPKKRKEKKNEKSDKN